MHLHRKFLDAFITVPGAQQVQTVAAPRKSLCTKHTTDVCMRWFPASTLIELAFLIQLRK